MEGRTQNQKPKLLNLKDYKEADLTNIETLKQIVINQFKENGLPISKIRSGRIKDKAYQGIYVYHSNGSTYYQSKRELISEIGNTRTYRRYRKEYKVSFISTENTEEFKTFLNMTTVESLSRQKYN